MDLKGRAARQVVAFRLTAGVAEKRIRELAKETGRIGWSDHARDRMEEREIFDVDALRVLREGHCTEAPEQTPRREWKCKMTKKIRGSREVGVVVVIIRDDRLWIKTVEWEDVI